MLGIKVCVDSILSCLGRVFERLSKSISVLNLLLIVFGLLVFSSLLVFAQAVKFEGNIDLDPKRENQKSLEISIEPNYNETIPVQIFARDIRGANRFLINLEYDKEQLRFDRYEDGNIIPYSQSYIAHEPDTRRESLESLAIDIESFWGNVNRITGLVGTIYFKPISPFEGARVTLKQMGMILYGRRYLISPDQIAMIYLSALVASDFDGNGIVDDKDYQMFVNGWGESGDSPFDLNNDRIVDGLDLAIFWNQYGKISNRLPDHNLRFALDENTEGRVAIGKPITLFKAVSHEITTYTKRYFDIDYGTGQIYTKEDAVYDYEDQKYYSLVVKILTENSKREHTRVIVDINNLKESPSRHPDKDWFLMIPGENSLSFHFADVPNEEGKTKIRGYYAELRKGTDGKWGERRTIHGKNNTAVTYSLLKETPHYANARLENGQDYYIRVSAWNAEGHGPWTEPQLGIPVDLPDLPGQGRRPLITALSPTSAHVKWEPPERDYSDIVNYDIRYIPRSTKDKSDANWTIIYDAVKNKDAFYEGREYIITGLDHGTQYYIQVRAKNVDGAGQWSNANILRLEDTEEPAVPDEPPHPILVEAGVTYLDIGWRAHSPTNSQGILNYDLRYILNSEENKSEEYWTVKTNILADEIAQEDVGLIVESSGLYDLKYRIQGLTEGQSYLVQLRSSNENGYSYWSNASSMSTLKNNVPKQLDPPVLVLAGTDFLDVGWKLPPAENTEGITDYDLRYILKEEQDKADNNWTVKEDILDDKYKDSVVGTVVEPSDLYDAIYQIDGLESGKEYLVRVKAKNDYGAGNWSYAVIMTTLENKVPSQPEPPFLISAGGTFLDIGWKSPDLDGVQGITNYDIRHILKSAPDRDVEINWTTLENIVTEKDEFYVDMTYRIGNLTKLTEYLVQVRAKNIVGMGQWSSASALSTSNDIDYDKDNDGLIEIRSLAQFYAIRYDLNGNGKADFDANKQVFNQAFPTGPSENRGCPKNVCVGYELQTDIDFEGMIWTRIDGEFTAILNGSGHVIKNFVVSNPRSDLGIFTHIVGTVKNLGVEDYRITELAHGRSVGVIALTNSGDIISCFASGIIEGDSNNNSGFVGGLVRTNRGRIKTSYAISQITSVSNGGLLVASNEGEILSCYSFGEFLGRRNAGGIAGWNTANGVIRNSYTVSKVEGRLGRAGSVIGGSPQGSGVFSNVYWDSEASDLPYGSGGGLYGGSASTTPQGMAEKTSSELKIPTDYSGIYASWDDLDIDGDSVNDTPWYFGTNADYPILKIDFNENGSATTTEFGNQVYVSLLVISSNTYTESNRQFAIKFNPPLVNSKSIESYSARYITNTQDDWTIISNVISGNVVPNANNEISFNIQNLNMGDYYVLQIRADIDKNKGLSSGWSDAVYSTEHSSFFMDFYASKVLGRTPILPDFSYAGYRSHKQPPPDIQSDGTNALGLQVFDVTAAKYGAIANDRISDQPAIVAAIADAEAMGGGIIFFPSGEFLIGMDSDGLDDDGGYPSIYIKSSKIVLKGSGSRKGGTVIRQVNKADKIAFSIGLSSIAYSSAIVSKTNRGSFWIEVSNTAELTVGQWIRFRARISNETHLNEYISPNTVSEFAPYYLDNSARRPFLWVDETHQIAEISGNRVRFHTPVSIPINPSHGFSLQLFHFLEEIGIEDICFQGSMLRDYVHLSERDSKYGLYRPIKFNSIVNSWMRRCSFVNVTVGYGSAHSASSSFYQITTGGNRGHYSSLLQTSSSMWLGFIEDVTYPNDSFEHGPSMSHGTSGTVHYYSDTDDDKEIDVHRTYPSYNNLWDNCSSGHLLGNSGSGRPPNHLDRFVLWNYKRLKAANGGSYSFWTNGTDFFLNPIIAGLKDYTIIDVVGNLMANSNTLPVGTESLVESLGEHVKPNSLFEAQLELRDDALPMWFTNLKSEWANLRATALDTPKILYMRDIPDTSFYSNESIQLELTNYIKALYSEDITVSVSTSGSSAISIPDIVVETAPPRVGNEEVIEKTYPINITPVVGEKGEADVTLTVSLGNESESLTFKVNNLGVLPPDPPLVRSVRGRGQELFVTWHDPSSSNTGKYDLRYKLTTAADIDANWTVIQDIEPTGNYEQAITATPPLTNGSSYDVQLSSENSEGTNSEWSDIVSGTPVSSVDYDADDDGLIEIYNFTELNAVRYDLDGNGTVTGSNSTNYTNAFDDAATSMGCPGTGCTGYELGVSLDFDDSAWATGSGWTPLGTSSSSFTATFQGNGKVLSSLLINTTSTGDANGSGSGFFGALSGAGQVIRLGLENVSISNMNSDQRVGGLVGSNNGGDIISCYVTGSVTGLRRGQFGADNTNYAGGLVGENKGSTSDFGHIRTSYSTANVTGRGAGSLIGLNDNNTSVFASYSTGSVTGLVQADKVSRVGAFIGHTKNIVTVKNNYATGLVDARSGSHIRKGGFIGDAGGSVHADSDYSGNLFDKSTTGVNSPTKWSGFNNNIGTLIQGKTTADLQTPTDYSGIYADWDDLDIDGDNTIDAPWDFGTSSQYPALKIDFNGDATATVEEFGPQR